MKHPTPYYPDIEIHHTIDDDWYYDTKNHREISFGEYLTAKKRYEEECREKSEACYRSTQSIIDFINNPMKMKIGKRLCLILFYQVKIY